MTFDVSLNAEIERGMDVANKPHDWDNLMGSARPQSGHRSDAMDGVPPMPSAYSDLPERDRPPLLRSEISRRVGVILGEQ